jgi:hypothetical protein
VGVGWRVGEKLFVLRCCRDWPVHFAEGFSRGGRCGVCGAVPKFVFEEFVRRDVG